MEKRAVISYEDTPIYQREDNDYSDLVVPGEPLVKESADALQSHPIDDAINAVADKTINGRSNG